MFKKLTLGIISVLILALAAFGVQAQDAIAAGDTVTGELTEDTFAVEYAYEGTADEVIVITLAPVDVMGELGSPAIVVRDASGTDLVRYDGYGTSNVVVLLPEDGTYTIVATRTDDKAGTSVGEYTLNVAAPQELAVGDSVDMTRPQTKPTISSIVATQPSFSPMSVKANTRLNSLSTRLILNSHLAHWIPLPQLAASWQHRAQSASSLANSFT